MPRILEKEDLLKNVVDASRLDCFWLDTVRPSSEQALLNFHESLVGYDIQVVYVPVKRTDETTTAKRRLRELASKTPKLSGSAYKFTRADAYEGEFG